MTIKCIGYYDEICPDRDANVSILSIKELTVRNYCTQCYELQMSYETWTNGKSKLPDHNVTAEYIKDTYIVKNI